MSPLDPVNSVVFNNYDSESRALPIPKIGNIQNTQSESVEPKGEGVTAFADQSEQESPTGTAQHLSEPTQPGQKVAEKEGIERAQTAAGQDEAARVAVSPPATAQTPSAKIQPDGSKITRVNGRVDQITDAAGRTKTFGYDRDGELQNVRMSGGNLGVVTLERNPDKQTWEVRHAASDNNFNLEKWHEGGKVTADKNGNLTYRTENEWSHTWNTDGSQINRDNAGRVAGVTQPNGTFSWFARDEQGEISRVSLNNGKTFERQKTAAKDGTVDWKSADGSSPNWQTVSVSNDGTVRARGAHEEKITDRNGKQTTAYPTQYYKSVYTDKNDKVHSAIDFNGRTKEATYNTDGTLGKVEVYARGGDQKPQVRYTKTEGDSFVREENGKRQTGKLTFETNGELKFTDAVTKETTVDKPSGASHVLDHQNRLKTVLQSDGGRLDLTHDNRGLSEMKEALPNGSERHWKRVEGGWKVGATAEDVEKSPIFAGKLTANRFDGNIHIEGKGQDLYLTDDGRTVVHDKATSAETTLDREGKVRAVSSRGGSWKFDYDQNGLSAVTFNPFSANPNKFTRTEGNVWKNDQGAVWKGNAEVKGDRLVLEAKDATGKRIISEEIFASGRSRTYKPDEDPKHKYLEQKRDEFVKDGKLPAGITIGQFHESQYLRAQARLGYVNAQLGMHRTGFNQLNSQRRGEDTPLAKEIISDNQNIENRSRELKKYLDDNDYQAFENKFNEYFPEAGKTSNGLPILAPFVAVNKKIAEFKGEKPSFEQIALSAANGVIDKVEGIGTAIKEHPEYLLIAAPAVIPVVGWYYAAGLAMAGTAVGGYEVGSGLNKVANGYAANNHQQIYQGTHDAAGGGVDLAMAYWGRPRGSRPKLWENKGEGTGAPTPNSPQSPKTPELTAQNGAKALPEPQIPQTKPKMPEAAQPVVGPESHNRYKLNQQLNDLIKQRALKYFDEFRNTLENAGKNGGAGKKPNTPIAPKTPEPQPELVGAGATPKKGTNAAPPPKPAEKVVPKETVDGSSGAKSGTPTGTNNVGAAGGVTPKTPQPLSTTPHEDFRNWEAIKEWVEPATPGGGKKVTPGDTSTLPEGYYWSNGSVKRNPNKVEEGYAPLDYVKDANGATGRLVLRPEDVRLSIPSTMRRNFKEQITTKINEKLSKENPTWTPKKLAAEVAKEVQKEMDRVQIHHAVPDELFRKHELGQVAYKIAEAKGENVVDAGSNLIGLAKDKSLIGKGLLGEGEKVGHWSSHTNYTARVISRMDELATRLKDKYGSLDPAQIPKNRLKEFEKDVLDAIGEIQIEFIGNIKKGDVPMTPEGRLSTLSDESRKYA